MVFVEQKDEAKTLAETVLLSLANKFSFGVNYSLFTTPYSTVRPPLSYTVWLATEFGTRSTPLFLSELSFRILTLLLIFQSQLYSLTFQLISILRSISIPMNYS